MSIRQPHAFKGNGGMGVGSQQMFASQILYQIEF